VPAFKLTWFFRWAGKAGWSENYYLAAGSRDAAVEAAHELVPWRLACLLRAPNIQLAYQRISEVAPPFRLHLTRLHVQGFRLSPAVQSSPWDGWHMQYSAGPGMKRPGALRGSPRPAGSTPNQLTTIGRFGTFYDGWVNALIANGGVIQVADKSVRYPVTGLAADFPGTGRIIATVPGHGWPVNTMQLASFAGLRVRPTLTWQHLVDVLDANTLRVHGTNCARVTWPGTGYMTKVSYQYYPITSAQLWRWGLHKVHRVYTLGSWTTVDPAAVIGFPHRSMTYWTCLGSCWSRRIKSS